MAEGRSADIRNQRFAPIADKAMATWEHLRQQSNVTLGTIELAGSEEPASSDARRHGRRRRRRGARRDEPGRAALAGAEPVPAARHPAPKARSGSW